MTKWVKVDQLEDSEPTHMYWPPFKVGDRVRYIYRPECPGVYGMLASVGHPPEYDGAQGIIYEVLADKWAHPYLVRLDEGNITRAICAAATEIELIP